MPYSHLVCLDTTEIGELQPNQMQWVSRESGIDDAVAELTLRCPNATVVIYKLHSMQKLKTNPTYQRYIVTDKGETLPV